MEPLHRRTPLVTGRYGRTATRQLLLKLENLQPVGSFKIRGIGALCQQLYAEGQRHFVCSSGGNAGLATAYATQKLGAVATIVTPETTAPSFRALLRAEGAEVLVHGAAWDDADKRARSMCADGKAAYVPPFDHPLLWTGHASMLHEVAEAIPPPDAVVVSVGGGGLLCGVLEGMHRVGWRDVPVFAAETSGAASYSAALQHGAPVDIGAITSLATTLGARQVCKRAFEWSQCHEIHSAVVSDAEAAAACIDFANEERLLVELACGAALAVARDHAKLTHAKRTLVIVCGGAGASLDKLLEWREQTGCSATP